MVGGNGEPAARRVRDYAKIGIDVVPIRNIIGPPFRRGGGRPVDNAKLGYF